MNNVRGILISIEFIMVNVIKVRVLFKICKLWVLKNCVLFWVKENKMLMGNKVISVINSVRGYDFG